MAQVAVAIKVLIVVQTISFFLISRDLHASIKAELAFIQAETYLAPQNFLISFSNLVVMLPLVK